MNVYVASSWRNTHQAKVVRALRGDGHEVYDFKNPEQGDTGFAWSQLGIKHEMIDAGRLSTALDKPRARDGFDKDMRALETCSACVLVLPCGRSAHLELGWAVGQRRLTIVYAPETTEPELMYRMCDYLVGSLDEVRQALSVRAPPPRWQRDMEKYLEKGFRPSQYTVDGKHTPLCGEFHHRPCHVCGVCWRHQSCRCLAPPMKDTNG